ncbi:MAG: hypothetical protein MUF77_03610 [Leptospira sp.]|nr:hypothetical protein [Leptospira sp.]
MIRSWYFLAVLLGLSLLMHGTSRYFFPFLETSSVYWAVFNEKKSNGIQTKHSKGSILVLGDSQIISGITPQMVANWNEIETNEIVYLPRPSEQPEGMLSLYDANLKSFSNLKKVYVNLSPISISKNSVVDSHKQLYTSFGSMESVQLLNPALRKFYFPNLSDLCWKVVITSFPFFSLNPNTSSLTNKFILGEDIEPILLDRKKEYESILKAFESSFSGSWVWKETDSNREISESEVFPKGSTEVFLTKREAAIETLKTLFQRWRDRGIEIVVLRIPFSPDMEADLQNTNGNVHLDQFLDEQKRIQKTVRGELQELKVLDIRRLGLNQKKYFADITHLNQKGRDAILRSNLKSLLDQTSSSP